MDKRPIGIFDSGLGGLCAVREAQRLLPFEDIIYFGDSGRVPYGSRSYETIKKYGRQDANFLKSKGVKIILAACGTVSSVAMDYLKESFSDIPIIGVVEAACEQAVKLSAQTQNKNIGIIATEATISKGAYEKKIAELDGDLKVYSRACPLFVPLVEGGHLGKDKITKLAAEHYLSEFRGLQLSSLILGCTHYPMIKAAIGEIVQTRLVDVGLCAIQKLSSELLERNLENESGKKGNLELYVSDKAPNFSRIASEFLGEPVSGVTEVEIEKY
ncbi:MAG: glutamate racemase [Oscillospiraceae bacterium]|nr:glutamate racemase [Oscillospiraceae bacterium]